MSKPRLSPGALVLLCLVAGTLHADPVSYEVSVPLAPLCLTGEFPVTVDTGAGPVAGTATLGGDAKGKLTGTLSFNGVDLALSGKVKFSSKKSKLALTATGPGEKIRLSGTLVGDAFEGASDGGKSAIAPGRGTFRLDAADAGPLVVALDYDIAIDAKGKLTGEGVASSCGIEVPIAATGKAGKSLKFKAKGAGFRWKARGDPAEEGFVVSWNGKGFGAKGAGDGLAFPLVTPPAGLSYPVSDVEYEAGEPIAPNVPSTNGGSAPDAWSVTPPLPAGLTIDPQSGVLSGAPEAVAPRRKHSITAANAAGAGTVEVAISVRGNRALSLAPQEGPFSDDDIRHFLSRTHLGGSPAEFATVAKAGIPASVDTMLDFRDDPSLEASAALLLVDARDPPGLEGGFPSAAQLARWWQHLLLGTDQPFQEVLALFWHEHFAASSEVLAAESRHWMVAHVNLWRKQGNGNLRDLLVAMARDWVMLTWLNGDTNTARSPNENFAREFWELFTLGVDNGYSQQDIEEASRAFTGYRSRLSDQTGQRFMVFDPGRHDHGDKVLLGVTIPGQNTGDDYEAVVDITLEKGKVAEFITRKLFSAFVYDDPPDEVVAELAGVLREADWEIAPLLSAMFRSEAFFSSRARAALIKSPVDFGVGFIRATGLPVSVDTLDSLLVSLGQRPTQPPTVDGWPEGELWLSSQGMVDRTNLVNLCIRSEEGLSVDVRDLLPEGTSTAEQVVDALAAFMRIAMTAEDRSDYTDYLNTVRTEDGAVLPSPFDIEDDGQIGERVRGLIYVMCQHPTYHLR